MDSPRLAQVSLAKLFGVFLYTGATSFGGGVVAYLHQQFVERQKWLDEDQFLAALEIGQTVPGLVSTNLSVIVGSRLRGGAGAVVAAVGMTLPGAVFVFILGLLYVHFRTNREVAATLDGVSAAAVGLILSVSLQIGWRQLKRWQDFAILAAVFLMAGVWHVSVVPLLAIIAPIAIWANRPARESLAAYHRRRSHYHAQMAAEHEKGVAANARANEQAS
jgi:chromate transporter